MFNLFNIEFIISRLTCISGSSSFQESAEMFSSVLDLVVALWGNLSAETDYGETGE